MTTTDPHARIAATREPAITVVIGTAGHIDHGKTTLLRALTGIDADRLPEERRRGMTIDVGYAHLAFDDGTVVDFVDVPGHEKLVGNMLVGAGEIDAALVVVAADDGPRAQTIEHVELLDALGVMDAVVALTKVDVVAGEPSRADAAERATRSLLAGTGLDGSPLVRMSGTTGEGLERLRAELRALVDRVRPGLAAARTHPARLAADRVFTVRGRGTVVTGSLRGGPVQVGDTLRVLPSGGSVRVREIQVHNTRVERVAAGGRVALNVAGADTSILRRGVVLSSDAAVLATRRLLVRAWPTHDRASGPRGARSARDAIPPGPARVSIGTAHADGIVGRARADRVELADGSIVADLRFATAIVAAPGDRLVLRRPAPIGLVAGAAVLDAAPPRGASRRRMSVGRVAALAAASTDAARATARLELHGAVQRPAGTRWDLAPDVAAAITAAAAATVARSEHGVAHADLRAALVRDLRRRVSIPESAAVDAVGALIAAAVAAGALGRAGDVVHRPGVETGPPPETLAAMDRLEAMLAVPSPPSLAAAALSAACPPDGVRALEAAGRLVRLDDDLAWAASAYDDLAATALRLAREAPLAPAALRDATGTSRKYVMAILEDLDRRGVLRRTSAGHVPGPRAPR